MKLLVIGNLDAVRGFALAGVQGEVVTTTSELHQALDRALENSDYGIVLITEDVANLARQRIDQLTWRGGLDDHGGSRQPAAEWQIAPLVIEIPGPAGPHPERMSLNEMIRRTTGVRI